MNRISGAWRTLCLTSKIGIQAGRDEVTDHLVSLAMAAAAASPDILSMCAVAIQIPVRTLPACLVKQRMPEACAPRKHF